MAEYAIYFILAVFLLFVLFKIFSLPLKFIGKIILNGIAGLAMLIIINLIGKYFNFFIGINIWTVLISGFLGLPGVVFLILFKTIL